MKKYTSPELDIVKVGLADIITTSFGTETTPKDDDDGNWDVVGIDAY